MSTARNAPGAGVRMVAAYLVSASVVLSGDEPAATIVIDPPHVQAQLAVVPFRADNLRIAPVFGAAGLSITPRVGHIHVSVDGASWVWAHASSDPVIVGGLAPGSHKLRMQLMTPNHQRLNEDAVDFAVPEAHTPATAGSVGWKQVHHAATQAFPDRLPARLVMDSPLPEPLGRGVVFIRYRAENLDIVPVFGPAALAVTPPVGHVHVTVDDTPWHWVDASRNPVIIQGLAPGMHKILIELTNASHQVLERQSVEVTIPAKGRTH